MTDGRRTEKGKRVAGVVTPLALGLLNGLADRKAPDRTVNARHVAKLRAAVLGRSAVDCMNVCAKIKAAGFSLDDLTDRYIPAVARTLGSKWHEDQISFAATAVGAARLQWLLRALNPRHGSRNERLTCREFSLSSRPERITLSARFC